MTTADTLDQGRASFGRRAWGAAYAQLSAADREAPLEPQDLERLTVAAHLVGRDDACADAWLRAHRAYLRLGDAAGAARCAYWLAQGYLNRGEPAHGSRPSPAYPRSCRRPAGRRPGKPGLRRGGPSERRCASAAARSGDPRRTSPAGA